MKISIFLYLRDNPILAELVAANAAYATISKFIANGKEISDALASLKNWVGAEEGHCQNNHLAVASLPN